MITWMPVGVHEMMTLSWNIDGALQIAEASRVPVPVRVSESVAFVTKFAPVMGTWRFNGLDAVSGFVNAKSTFCGPNVDEVLKPVDGTVMDVKLVMVPA